MHTSRTNFKRKGKIISFVPLFLNFSFPFILLAHSSQVLIPHAVCIAVLLSLFLVIRNIRTVPSLTLLTCTCISFIHYLLPNPSCTFLLSLLVVRPAVNPISLPSFSSSRYKTSNIPFIHSAVSLTYSLPISPVFFPVSFISPPF